MKRSLIIRHGSFGLVAFALSLFAWGEVQAQTPIDGVRGDVHLNLGWYGSLGAGARADIPIVKNGFLDNVVDDLALTVGGDIFFWNSGHRYHHDDDLSFAAIAAVQWNMYLNPEWSVFPELGLAILFGRYGYYHNDRDPDRRVFLDPYIGVGGRYHFSRRNAVFLRLSWPAGLSIGLNF